ncbi:AAA family ATPase [Myroides indicus]|uniref:Dynein-related subfamily AAA family protein n=1 Tax=Myroides indicus TaxID=1323422 RepID=A0A4R7F568_9FLAO|nr:AAA family ATPase [Myroides indicus]TDS59623.1 dynein-related subfamily AAA family protein [Myroides indicus]
MDEIEKKAWKEALEYAFNQLKSIKDFGKNAFKNYAIDLGGNLYPNKIVLEYCEAFLNKNYPKYSVTKQLGGGKPINDFLESKGAKGVILNDDTNSTNVNYWIFSPGSDASFWEEFLDDQIIAIGWDDLGNLLDYASKDQLKQALINLYNYETNPYNATNANYEFAQEMKIGDIVICKKGRNKLIGYGKIVSDYFFNDDRVELKSCRKVKWIKSGEWNVDHTLVMKTLTNITAYLADNDSSYKYYQKLIDIMNSDTSTIFRKEINLLKYKKQIILQGPPGTGKTREAKMIAEELIGDTSKQLRPKQIDSSIIRKFITKNLFIKTVAGDAKYKIIDISSSHVQSQKNSGTIDKTSFKSIEKAYNDNIWEESSSNSPDRRARAFAKYIYDNYEQTFPNDNSDQIKLIQFHPSYTYEDFVRGIVSKPNEDGDGIVYEAENKLLADFAKKALDNYIESNKTDVIVREENSVFYAFIESIKDELAQNENHKYDITEAVYLFSADETRFKYKGDNWVAHSKGLNMKFSELKKIIDLGATERQDIKKMTDVEELTRQHATYFIKIVEKYYDFKKTFKESVPTHAKIELKNYVLIIDEINRANLSSVLGELIYALEYRGEAVESMYAVGNDSKLILPPNLYIIGTMNTADRSVGHIDYAIRRRFAFVDVLPKDLSEEDNILFDSELFYQVEKLFDTNLSPEFEKKDVQLGHSYFIDKSTDGGSMDIRLDFEIKPILFEYVKDGVLIGDDIKKLIDDLEPSI